MTKDELLSLTRIIPMRGDDADWPLIIGRIRKVGYHNIDIDQNLDWPPQTTANLSAGKPRHPRWHRGMALIGLYLKVTARYRS